MTGPVILVWRSQPFYAARFLMIIGGARCNDHQKAPEQRKRVGNARLL